ncbi:MAG: hypothetical protein M5U28_21400 [Sandaracinaceae bacterium]|nr:hypothetical protein [Sandaracinaceae bacterium]
MTNENDEDAGHYVEFDECYQHGRRMRRRSRRIDLAADDPRIHLADLLAVMRFAEQAKPSGRLTASELIARIGEALFEAPAGSMRLTGYRVAMSGSPGLGRRGWSNVPDHATAPDAGPDAPHGADTADATEDD